MQISRPQDVNFLAPPAPPPCPKCGSKDLDEFLDYDTNLPFWICLTCGLEFKEDDTVLP